MIVQCHHPMPPSSRARHSLVLIKETNISILQKSIVLSMMRFFLGTNIFLLLSVNQAYPQEGCCSQKYLNCDANWCGSSEDACENCPGNPSTVWLSNGALQANSCKQRWEGCGDDPSACCAGATCRPNSGGNWMQCLADTDDPAISNPATPTTAPVNDPVPVPTEPPMNPTAAPVTPTAPPTTGSTPQPVTPAPVTPTQSPTTSPTRTPSPTSEPFLLSTTNAMNAWDVFQGLSHLTNVNSENPPIYALVSE